MECHRGTDPNAASSLMSIYCFLIIKIPHEYTGNDIPLTSESSNKSLKPNISIYNSVM